MSAASALSGWLLCSTSSAAAERSVICQAVTAPNATTRRASTAPMMRSRPGSVVAAARSWSTPSAHAVRRGGAGVGRGWSGPAARGGGRACGGTAGIVGAGAPGGAALALLLICHLTSPMVIGRSPPPGRQEARAEVHGRKYRRRD